ncbi:MAG: hypothetical protein AABW81_01615 [Nanoarchaeota archaeon]
MSVNLNHMNRFSVLFQDKTLKNKRIKKCQTTKTRSTKKLEIFGAPKIFDFQGF